MVNRHAKASAVAVEAADGEMVKTLENTLAGRVLKDLQDPLNEIVHNAVRSAILVASKVEEAPVKDRSTIARPAAGGRCAKVWDALDKMSEQKGGTPSLQEVRKEAMRRRWNKSTATIQYYRWRNFHGITRGSARAGGTSARA